MLGVPPKSSGGATNRCVMSRLTRWGRGLFSPAYRSNLWDHIDAFAAGPDNAGYRWLGRPILLPAPLQLSDRYT